MGDTNMDREIKATFKPRARLLLQLGDQLIKNESIALIELVKNAYDADATKVDIVLENPEEPDDAIITIEDDGHGMSADIVENVWLEPGSDFKSKQIDEGRVSPEYKRLPIGEKGIGRFGVHKLGNVIELTTKTATDKEVYVHILWNDFNKFRYLNEVPIKIFERKEPQYFVDGKTGTRIRISSFRKAWDRRMARNVMRAITSLSSPFNLKSSFHANFTIPGMSYWFSGLLTWKSVKDHALYRFNITIKESRIDQFEYEFMPWQTMSKLNGRVVDNSNEYIKESAQLTKEVIINGKKEDIPYSIQEKGIGIIRFEGYIFDLDGFVLNMGVSDKRGLKDYLKENGGIKVFRDGLRVYDYGEPENDWLNLDHRRFQQPTKAVSNNLIIGAVYLDRAESRELKEKTNREGFVENDAYEHFKMALLQSLDLVETLRQTDKRILRQYYGPSIQSQPVLHLLGEAQRYVERNVEKEDVRKQIVKYLVKIESDYKIINENLLKAAGAGLSMSIVVHEIEKIIAEVTKVLQSKENSERALNLVLHLGSLVDGYSEIVRRSTKEQENIIDIIEQAVFNTEFRFEYHHITLVKGYKDYNGTKLTSFSKQLLLGSILNVFDNSIYWTHRKYVNETERKLGYEKKIFVNVYEEEEFLNVVIADNGLGFLLGTDDITEPFVSAKPGGIGLGLHIASEVMQAQGGRLIFPDARDFEIPEEFTHGAIVCFQLKK